MALKISSRISIPVPLPTAHVHRGFVLDAKDRLEVTSFRLTDAEAKQIRATAKQLGVSYSEFVRWVCTHASDELDKELKLSEFR